MELARTPADLLIALVEELPEESSFIASMRGGRDWRGWTRTQSLLADIYDAVNVNTTATGNFKKRPKIAPWPRPKSKPRRQKTVADIRRTFGRG